MRKQPVHRGDSTTDSHTPDTERAPSALAAGRVASAALQRLGSLADRAMLWTVLALAVGAALLVSYGQVAQAQAGGAAFYRWSLSQEYLVAGSPTGAEVSFTIEFTPADATSTVTRAYVSQEGSVSATVGPESVATVGFRSFGVLHQRGDFTIPAGRDLTCDNTARPIVCSLSLRPDDDRDVLVADTGYFGIVHLQHRVVDPFIVTIEHGANDIHEFEVGGDEASAISILDVVETAPGLLTVEVGQTPDPLVAGSQAGARPTIRVSYAATSTVTRIAVSEGLLQFTVSTTTAAAPNEGQTIGFRYEDPESRGELTEMRVLSVPAQDLVCDDLTVTPITCSLPLGSEAHEVIVADTGVAGTFELEAEVWGRQTLAFTVHEGGDTDTYRYAPTRILTGSVTVGETAPGPGPSPGGRAEAVRLSAERGSGEAELRWSNPGDSSITGYQYRYKVREDDYGDWTPIEASGPDTTEHTVTGLVNGRRHTFQIRALAEQTAGDPSNEVTVTPARSRPQFDDFDDPDQPPEPPPPPPPDRTSTFLEGGGTLRSQPFSPSRPVRATVESPFGGFVAITIESNERRIAPPGYTLAGSTVDITAPMATANDPLMLTFEVRTMVAPDELAVLRDGVAVEECAGLAGVADPDPCVSSRTAGNGTAVLMVLTSEASEWQFGVALEPESTATPTPPPPPTLTPTPTPTATPTPGPTATPTPTATPRPEPTATPPPTSTPVPTATPRPTSTPTPSPVPPQPTSTPVPPMDEGGLSAGLIVLIVVAVAVVIVGAAVFVLRRR